MFSHRVIIFFCIMILTISVGNLYLFVSRE